MYYYTPIHIGTSVFFSASIILSSCLIKYSFSNNKGIEQFLVIRQTFHFHLDPREGYMTKERESFKTLNSYFFLPFQTIKFLVLGLPKKSKKKIHEMNENK